MADIGEDHPVAEQERPKLWRLVEETPQLDWLLLTKRVATAHQWLPQRWLWEGFPPNVWMGFSAEDQQRYDERVRPALNLRAHVTFCSYEPALGPINFRLDGNNLHWVIAGGESSSPASRSRPMHPAWARSARDQCAASGVAYHFKQWGEWRPYQPQLQHACPASGRSASGSYRSYRAGGAEHHAFQKGTHAEADLAGGHVSRLLLSIAACSQEELDAMGASIGEGDRARLLSALDEG